jgi:acyl-CoA thioesterase FadM
VFAPASLEEAPADGRRRLPVVRAETNFRAPMRLGDRLAVLPRIRRLRARWLAIDYAIVGEAEGVVRAEVRLTHAGVAAAIGAGQASGSAEGAGLAAVPRSMALSDSLRARLRAALGEAS